jgi:DNA-binding beta-propeller fold protein YncE
MTVLVAEERVSTEHESPVLDVASTEPACTDRSFAFPGHPAGLAVASDGTLFASDATSRTIWRIDDGGGRVASTRPSGGVPDATYAEMRVLSPEGLAMASDGTLFVADASGHRIWTVSPGGELHLLAGSASGYRDGPSGDALFRRPCDVAVGPDGTCYVADTGNHRIRIIAPDGAVTTLAGSIYDYGEGRGPHGRFREPLALDVDHDGTCYVADTGNNAIRRITPDGEVTTLAGAPPGGDRDGLGADVGLRWPTGLALGADGDLWVADHGNGALRRIDHSGASTTHVRLSGRRFPVAVVSAPDGKVVVAAVVLDDVRRPQVCLISVGAGR